MGKKINVNRHDTDKSETFLPNYQECFESISNKEVKLLELGVFHGGSLLLWRDYFEKGKIVGLDIKPIHFDDMTGRIQVYQGRQEDIALLDRIAQETAPDGFDVIIDDCSHIGELTRISFWHLFNNHLKSGGIYVIEDWGTGYWDSWPDGKKYKQLLKHGFSKSIRSFLELLMKMTMSSNTLPMRILRNKLYKGKFPSHQAGMVGFIKELVDECAMDDITCPDRGISPYRPSKFKKMEIFNGQAFIFKV